MNARGPQGVYVRLRSSTPATDPPRRHGHCPKPGGGRVPRLAPVVVSGTGRGRGAAPAGSAKRGADPVRPRPTRDRPEDAWLAGEPRGSDDRGEVRAPIAVMSLIRGSTSSR